MLQLDQIVDDLFEPETGRKKAKFQRSFPYGTTKSDLRKKLGLLVAAYYEDCGTYELEAENLYEAMRSAVSSYTSNKSALIQTYKIFEKFLNEGYGLQLQCKFPPIDVSNTFERLMYMAKELQMSEKTLVELHDELWVSQRTIDDDFRKLTGRDEENILQVCGKRFVVDEVRRSKGKLQFASTVHPLFLTYNLSQVLVTLKGLKVMSQDPVMGAYALGSAVAIWEQLSQYARNRILYVFDNIIPEEVDWYRELEDVLENFPGNTPPNSHFRTERNYSTYTTDGASVLLEAMKSGSTFVLEYDDPEVGPVFFLDCRVVPRTWYPDQIQIETKGDVITLEISRVLGSAYSKEELI